MQIINAFKPNPTSKVNNPIHILYYMFTLCIAQFYFGYTLIYLSAIRFDVIDRVFDIDFDQSFAEGLFQGIMPIGGAVGAISSAYFVSKFSRKHLIFIFNGVAIVLSLMSLITSFELFFVVRFLQGACCGLFSAVIPMIIKENSPPELINITGTFSNLFIILGLFFLYLFGFFLGFITGDWTGQSYWKIIFLLPVFTSLAQCWLLWSIYPYETPKYLAMNNQIQQLKVLLPHFYKQEYVEEILQENIMHHGPKQSTNNSVGGNQNNHYNSKCALFYAIFYAFLCPMVGINVMMSYGGDVASKVMPSLRPVMPAILMFLYFCFSFISMIYVGRYGRKLITMVGTIGLVIALYLITAGYFLKSTNLALAQIIIIISMIFYLFAYGMTYAPVMWIWVSQALQPNYIGYAVMVNWGGASLVMILFPIVIQYLPDNNPGFIFLYFGTYGLLSLIITSRFMIQTKDKKEYEITEEYRKLDQQYFEVEQPHSYELGLLKNSDV